MTGTTSPAAEDRGPTRRRVLAGAATALGAGASAGFVGDASAQILQPALVPTPERWSDANLTGFMVHLGGRISPTTPDEIPACDFADWPPDEAYAYDAALINHEGPDTQEEDVEVYLDWNLNVDPGDLFIVNTSTRCDTDYVGLQLEQIGRRFLATARDPAGETTADGDSGQTGPGFGAVEGLLAATGLGGLLAWRRSR